MFRYVFSKANLLLAPALLLLAGLCLPPAAAARPSGPPDAAAVLLDSLRVSSEEQGGLLTARVSGVLPVDFRDLSAVLVEPANWCDFIPLVFNVKACTHDAGRLRIYVSRKFYEAPEDSYLLDYRFQLVSRGQDGLKILLTSAEGPLGTKDYRIELEARPAAGGTLVEMVSGHRQSGMSRLAADSYLATRGRSKIGFSVSGEDRNGRPVYVKGIKGVVERNAVRYFLALVAFLETRDLPVAERFQARLESWFALTARYPRQLYEMTREEYLQAKWKERENQLRLQQLASRAQAQDG